MVTKSPLPVLPPVETEVKAGAEVEGVEVEVVVVEEKDREVEVGVVEKTDQEVGVEVLEEQDLPVRVRAEIEVLEEAKIGPNQNQKAVLNPSQNQKAEADLGPRAKKQNEKTKVVP